MCVFSVLKYKEIGRREAAHVEFQATLILAVIVGCFVRHKLLILTTMSKQPLYGEVAVT